MKQYLDLIRDVLFNGEDTADRTGTGTLSVFDRSLRFDLAEGFPLVTTKKMHIKSIIHELLWFLSGDTNIDYLTRHGVTIWNSWADKNGDLGRVYGAQWRNWRGIPEKSVFVVYVDQISKLIHEIKTNPTSRRQLVSAWNPAEIDGMALLPCHYAFQTSTHGGRLNLKFHMRSCDVFLGLPFNIASYALLTHILAQQTGYEPGMLTFNGGDVHIYKNHIKQLRQQLTREPKSLPWLEIKRNPLNFDRYQYEDFEVHHYLPYPAIKGEVSV